MNRHRTDIEITDLGEGIYCLNEYDLDNVFLVVGDEKACLIDTGAGIADLSAVVGGLTDKPLTVLITHAHADHAGGAVWFKDVYIHPVDLKRGRYYCHPSGKMYFLSMHKYKRKSHNVRMSDCFQKKYTPRFHPIEEGFTLDLGGRKIETYFTPGHTRGSLTFRDTLTGALFAGDNVNPMVTLHFPNATTVEKWKAGAEKTLKIAGDKPVYIGHGKGPLDKTLTEKAIEYAEEIMTEDEKFSFKAKTKRGEEKYPKIVYKPYKIRERSR